MVGVTVVSSLTDYRRMINHNLKEIEKFDTDTAQQNVAIRYFVPPVPATERGFYLNLQQRYRLLTSQKFPYRLQC